MFKRQKEKKIDNIQTLRAFKLKMSERLNSQIDRQMRQNDKQTN